MKPKIYDLCVVGAGIAGLNVLFVAAKYLKKDSKVLLVDKNPGAGGMWNSAYDFVRLHQPHTLFTVGNFKWNLSQENDYLAKRPEVVDYLNRSLEKLKNRFSLEVQYNCTLIANGEETVSGEDYAVATFSQEGEEFSIRSRYLVKAFGINVQPLKALELTSDKVHSIPISKVPARVEDIRESGKPVFVIGGGKSGADAAHFLLKQKIENQIHLLSGRGIVFSRRDIFFPTGVNRFFGGTVPTDAFIELSNKFDGTNATEIIDYFLGKYGIKISDSAMSSVFGLLSPGEAQTLINKLNSIINDHLEDVTNDGEGVSLVLRSGKTIQTDPGAWIINATEAVFNSTSEYEPYMSEKATTISLNKKSAIGVFSTYGSFFLAHLLFSKKIKTTPLFELDVEQLFMSHKPAFHPIAVQQMLYNTVLLVDALPLSVFNEWGANLDNWFPLYRRMFATLGLLMNKKQILSHAKKSLQKSAEHYGIRCGELQGNFHHQQS